MLATVSAEGKSFTGSRPLRRTFRGFSVAFVGADGAGKSTLVKNLQRLWPAVTRSIFMGAGIDQANYALPTSRWLTRRKRRRLKRLMENPDVLPPARLMSQDQLAAVSGGRLVKLVGLVNRVAEESYRACVIATFKIRGFVVLCDRYFLFEHRLETNPNERLSVRIHNWLLRRFYPRPNLVIHLDASPEFLQRRKPEWPLEHLEHQCKVIKEQNSLVRHFVRIDATQPLAIVLDSVVETILKHVDVEK